MLTHELTLEQVKIIMRAHNVEDISYEEAVKEIYFWQYNGTDGTSFSDNLFRLFQKADRNNIRRLARGFPMRYYVYLKWYNNELNWIEEEFARLHCES